jgi:hypothetical protein
VIWQRKKDKSPIIHKKIQEKTKKTTYAIRKKKGASSKQPPKTGLQAAPQPKGPNAEPHSDNHQHERSHYSTEEKSKHTNHEQPHHANCKKGE